MILHRIEPNANQQIGGLQRRRLGRGPGKEANGVDVAIGQNSLGFVGQQGWTAECLAETANRRRCISLPRLGSDQQQRFPALRQHSTGFLQGTGVGPQPDRRLLRERAAAGTEARRPGVLGVEVDLHRAARPGQRDLDGGCDALACFIRAQPHLRLADRRVERLLVECLVLRRCRTVGKEQQWRLFQRGIGDTVGRAGGAGSDAGQNNTWFSTQFASYRGHDGGRGFAARQDEINAGLVGRLRSEPDSSRRRGYRKCARCPVPSALQQ